MADPAIFGQLRQRALAMRPQDLGIVPTPHEAYGAVMDWSVGTGVATVVAFSTGDASIYLSSGGGFIGGAQQEAVGTAARRFVAAANHALNLATLTSETPLPGDGMALFYILTGDGIFTASASVDDLGEKRLALSPLFYAAQDIVSAYRALDR